MIFTVVGCSSDELKKINHEEITFGTLKIYEDGTLVKGIELMENEELLADSIKLYNNSTFLSVEKEETENDVKIDPIMTDGQLEETYSASYFTIDVQSTGNNYYIGYKGNGIFKVIASGDEFKERPYEYFIESEELKELIVENK
jgi:hypothetical protein